jgi:hypothetical protein
MRLLVASLVQLGEARPHGAISWLAETLRTSRQTIYDIGHRAEAHPAATPAPTESAPTGADRTTLARAALVLLVVGAMHLRGVEYALWALLGRRRSLGWLAELVDEAGTRAGQALARADWSGASSMIVARDELYFDKLAFLVTIDTASLAVVSGHVETGADAERWAVSLALDEVRTGHRIVGLVEDAARYFPASVGLSAELLDAPFRLVVQKDTWHLLDAAAQAVTDADRRALRLLASAEHTASQVAPGLWRLRRPGATGQAEHRAAEAAIDEADALRRAVDLLAEALSVVDATSGAILDRETAEWYLQAIVAYLDERGGAIGQALAGRIHDQAPALLSFHDWLELDLEPWRDRARAHFGEAQVAEIFERAVARAWQRARAVTNGHRPRRVAERAAAHVASLCQNDPVACDLARQLHDRLEGVVRSSSAVECFNGLLRAYLWGRRHLQDRRTAQNWLNLLILWHNMRPFARGKRAGQSPYQLADVRMLDPEGNETLDWLTAIGYPAAA